jgi:hypothetical protein
LFLFLNVALPPSRPPALPPSLPQELVTGQGIWEQLSSGNVWAIGDGKGLL